MSVAWPALIERAVFLQLDAQATLRPTVEGCADHEGFSDCVRNAR